MKAAVIHRVWLGIKVLAGGAIALTSWGPATAWDSGSLEIIRRYTNPFLETYPITAWTGIQLGFQPSAKGKAHAELVTFPSSRFETGRFEAFVSLQKDSHGKVLRAPLVLYVPGIFSDLESDRSYATISWFAQRGYHVLYLPNSFTKRYVELRPRNLPGDFIFEAGNALEVLRQVQENLSAQGSLTQTYLVGESYGSFLASVIASKDLRELSHEIDGTVTLLCPPISVGQALKNLDHVMDETESQYQELNSFTQYWVGLDYYFSHSYLDLNAHSVGLAKGLFIFNGFNKSLAAFLRSLDSTFHLNKLPPLDSGDEVDAWRQKLRFKTYLTDFNPRLQSDYDGPRGQIETYVATASLEGTEFSALSSPDDPLNNPGPNGRTDYPRWLTLLPDTGGHCGYMGLSWFQDLLDQNFGKERRS